MQPWPCPACGRDRLPDEPCACGRLGPVEATREGLLSSWWRLEDVNAGARVRRSGGRIVEGVGGQRVHRPLRAPEWAHEVRAGQEQLGVLDVDEGERAAWWTRVHLGENRWALGAIEPTGARVGLAWTVAVLGLVARGRAHGVVKWKQAWSRRGNRVERAPAYSSDVSLMAGELGGDEQGLEAVLQSTLKAELRSLHVLLYAAGTKDGHAWLAARAGSPEPGVDAALLSWIDDAPEVSAILVQRALVGVGLLMDR